MTKKKNAKQKKKGNHIVPGAAIAAPSIQQRRRKRMEQRKRKLHSVVDIHDNVYSDIDDEVEVVSKPAAPARKRQRGQLPPRPPPKPRTKKATKPPPLPRPRQNPKRNNVDAAKASKDDATTPQDNHHEDDDGNASDSSMETPYRMNLTQQNIPVKSARKKKKRKKGSESSVDGNSSSDSDSDSSSNNSDDDSSSSSDEDDGYGGPMFESPLSQPPEYLEGKHQQKHPPPPPLAKQNREPLRPGDVIAYQNTTVAVAGSAMGRGRAVVLATHPAKEYPLILHNGALLPSSTPIQRIAEFRNGTLYGHPGRHKPISKFRLKERQLDLPGVDKVNHATGLLQQAASLKQMKSTIETTAVAYLRGDKDNSKDKKKKSRGKENSQPDSNADSSDSESDDDKKQEASSKGKHKGAKSGDADDDSDDHSTSSTSSSLTIPSLRPVSEKRAISDEVLKKPPLASVAPTPSKSTSLTLTKFIPKSKRKSRGSGKTSKTKAEEAVETVKDASAAKKETISGQAKAAPKKNDKTSGSPQKSLSPDEFAKEAAAALLCLHGDIPQTRREAPQLQTQHDQPSTNGADHDDSDDASTSQAPQLQTQQDEPLTRREKSSAHDTDSEDSHDRPKTETKSKRQPIEKKSLPRPAAATQDSDCDTDEEFLAIQKRKDKDKKARGDDPSLLKGTNERSNGPSTERPVAAAATSTSASRADAASKANPEGDAPPKRKSLETSLRSNIDLASSDDDDDDDFGGLRERVFRRSTGGRKSDAAASASRRPSPNDKSKNEAKKEDALIGQSISFQPQNDNEPGISPIVPVLSAKRDELLDASDSDEEFDRQIQENLENNTSALLRIKKDSVASSNKSVGSDACAEDCHDEDSRQMERKRKPEPKVQPRASSSKRWFGLSQPRPFAQGSDKKQPRASQQGSPSTKKQRKSVGKKSSIRSQKPLFEPLTLVPTRRLSYGADSPINLESDGSDANEEKAEEESPPCLAKAYRKLEMRKQQQRQKSGGRESIETGKRDKTVAKSKDHRKTGGKKGKRSTRQRTSPKGSSGKRRDSRPKAPRARVHHDSDADSESEIDMNPRTRRSSRPPRYPTISMKRAESPALRKESSQSEAEFEWQEEGSGTSHRKDERIGFGGRGSYESSDSDDECVRPQKNQEARSNSRRIASTKRRGNESDVSSLESDDEARRKKQIRRSRELAERGRQQTSKRPSAGTKRKKSSDEASVPSVVDLTNEESANASKGRQVSAKQPILSSARKRRRVRGLPPTSDNYRAITKQKSLKANHRSREHTSRLEMETNVPNRFELSSSSDDDYNTHAANKRQSNRSAAGAKSTKIIKKPAAKTGGRLKASESGSIFDFDSCDENEKSLALSTRKRYVNTRA